jgi:hypothetical protein
VHDQIVFRDFRQEGRLGRSFRKVKPVMRNIE